MHRKKSQSKTILTKKDLNSKIEKIGNKGKAKLEELDANYLESVANKVHVEALSSDKPHILYTSSTLLFDALLANDGVYAKIWMLDFGAPYHVTPHREWFSIDKISSYGIVRFGDSYTCDIIGIEDRCCASHQYRVVLD